MEHLSRFSVTVSNNGTVAEADHLEDIPTTIQPI